MSAYYYTVNWNARQYRAALPVYGIQKAADLLGVPVHCVSRGALSSLPEWKTVEKLAQDEYVRLTLEVSSLQAEVTRLQSIESRVKALEADNAVLLEVTKEYADWRNWQRLDQSTGAIVYQGNEELTADGCDPAQLAIAKLHKDGDK